MHFVATKEGEVSSSITSSRWWAGLISSETIVSYAPSQNASFRNTSLSIMRQVFTEKIWIGRRLVLVTLGDHFIMIWSWTAPWAPVEFSQLLRCGVQVREAATWSGGTKLFLKHIFTFSMNFFRQGLHRKHHIYEWSDSKNANVVYKQNPTKLLVQMCTLENCLRCSFWSARVRDW